MYNEIIEKFIAAQQAARQAYQDAANFERDMLAGTGTGEPFFAVGVRRDHRQNNELEKFCQSLAGNVVSRARREFAPAGARLDIDNSAEYERAGLDIQKALRKGGHPGSRQALGLPHRPLQGRWRGGDGLPSGRIADRPQLWPASQC
ncbi:hypothetical protein ACUXAV_005813 [Cupriavidus metallidurans]|uniref:hypothetical protein n=1 Tax=Cupriavidus metallidurans TaxID=119219 RepID=UPI000A608128|nr:hypothetical protein [Cupriavidus metallidurans]MDE4922908.1 hypothetical protein [Cupriavidus metallidurans]